eukprot:TRINITY_DN118_c0_g1_i5.p1 TRINITY_DN118_c0_g1~~TRINITY_DN118_c0_g1_i5.p1  ORF type:complete len:182 (+),score=44.18 TRINITY_DN118_c0_g1_i5:92-637(+)
MSATTLMIKSLPSRWSADDILKVIDGLGFHGDYDFFYMPRRTASDKAQALGYAFINFTDAAVAEKFVGSAQNGQLTFRSRVASAVPARIQGLENLKSHLEMKDHSKRKKVAVCLEKSTPALVSVGPKSPASTTASVSMQDTVSTAFFATSEVLGQNKQRASRRWADMFDEDEDVTDFSGYY